MKVTVYRDRYGEVSGFQVSGHSTYNTHGEDILCSAVSVLTINCMNSVEALTEDEPLIQAVNEEEGFVHFRLKTISEGSRLLLRSWLLGMESIAETYGDYIQIEFEED
jgi:hypothetical protein